MRVCSGRLRSAREVDPQPLQWALDVADRVDGDAGVERRRLQLRVSEQHLDHANIDALLEQMGRSCAAAYVATRAWRCLPAPWWQWTARLS